MIPVNYLVHILAHSKLSVNIIAAVGLSIIINFEYMYMHFESYTLLYNPKGPKFGDLFLYYSVDLY